ncbi:MAG: VWA domain-containing protein, partial [bacterium]|nr:VWA domain-containing protein [bacterium]
GNGVVETGEDCDDGTLNGTYGYCDDNCFYTDAFYCGDGYLAGSEACDCGTSSNFTTVSADPSSWAAINGCDVANGLYSSDIDLSCAYNCTAPGLACGDGTVNGSEECDGDYEEWEGATCSDGTQCSSDSDCDSGSCGSASGGVDACGISAICEDFSTAGQDCEIGADCKDDEGDGGYCTTNDTCSSSLYAGGECDDATDCGSWYTTTCSTATYETYHYRGCDDTTCGWDSWSACVGGEQVCGNGELEGTEECDDGNDSSHDACTNECIANVCGDDYVNVGVESCDDGDGNGEECDASYGGTCNYCNSACQYKTRTGGFCGDGEVDGTYEVCDGGYSTQMTYYNITEDATYGTCDPDEYLSSTSDDGGTTYACLWLGVCNGGTEHGEKCVLDYTNYAGTGATPIDLGYTECEDTPTESDPEGGGTCQAPICADDCGSSCPTSYETTGLEVQSEIGTTKVDSIDLYSYQNNEGDSPDSGVIYIPACNVATEITADVDDSEMTLPDVDVVFVTDFSGSMDNQPDGTSGSASAQNRRIDYVAEATEEAISELFDAFSGSGADVRIGMISYTTQNNTAPGTGYCTSGLVTYEGASDDMGSWGVTLANSAWESILVGYAQLYPSCVNSSSGGTPTYSGVQAASKMLLGSSADVKIVVLLTDGYPTYNKDFYVSGTADDCGTYASRSFSGGIGTYSGTDRCVAEIYSDYVGNSSYSDIIYYSATVNDSSSLQGYMAHVSSNECDWDDIDSSSDCEGGYAYTAENSEEILEMYDAIVDSIIGTTLFENATDNDGNITVSNGSVVGGDDIELPFPEGFVCKSTEQEIPIRHEMYGEGYLEFSDFNLTYCPYQ